MRPACSTAVWTTAFASIRESAFKRQRERRFVLRGAAGGRNYTFDTEYALCGKYMGMGNFVRKGSYIDPDYVYGVLSNRKISKGCTV